MPTGGSTTTGTGTGGRAGRAHRDMAASRCHVALDDAGSAVAISTAAVVEVVEEPAITPIPLSDPRIAGVCNLRGSPVPVVDLALLLGGAAGPGGHLVVVRSSGRPVALRVRRVHGIVDDDRVGTDASAPAWCDAMIDLGTGHDGRRRHVRGLTAAALDTLLAAVGDGIADRRAP